MSEHSNDRPGPSDAPFTEHQWHEFQKSDYLAGKMVGGLMASIFTLGIVIYSTVVWTIMH